MFPGEAGEAERSAEKSEKTAAGAPVTAAGGAAPTAIVLSNNTGYTYTWARTGGGIYTITADGNAFTANKTIKKIISKKISALIRC